MQRDTLTVLKFDQSLNSSIINNLNNKDSQDDNINLIDEEDNKDNFDQDKGNNQS